MDELIIHTKDFVPYLVNKHKLPSVWDIEVFQQNQIALTGESGVGKSVFLKSLTYIYQPQSGSVFFRNKKVDSSNVVSYRSKVLYLNQNPYFFRDTIWEYLEHILSFSVYNMVFQDFKVRAKAIADKINFDETLFSSNPNELSGGQKQKVKLILSMLISPNVLILDEPTSQMDLKSSMRCEGLILEWVNQNVDRAFIWVSHSRDQLGRIGSHYFELSADGLIQR